MRKIPFGRPIIGEAEKKAVMDVLDGPILVHGPRAEEFEKKFAARTGAAAAVSCSSCTAGMHLAWFDLGLGPGDEVLTPAMTHTATAHAVELCGARPVFVDAELETGNINLDLLESLVTSATRGLVVVHYLGRPVDMDRVNQIASRHGLFVLEDCALAVGSEYKGVHAGLLGDAGCFSFYPVKHMTTAEGGMFITRNTDLADRVRRKRAFGVDRHMGERKVPGQYDVNMLGFNYRLNEIQAALGIVQLDRIDSFLEVREKNYQTLARALAEVDEVRLFESSRGDFKSSHYCLSVLLQGDWPQKRFELVRRLGELGVGTSVYYPQAVPHMTYYREKYGYGPEEFPGASAVAAGSIALPVGPHLGEEDMEYIAESLKQAITEAA